MTEHERLRYKFLDKVADWGVATVEHGTDDQIKALQLGLETLVTLILDPPADPTEREQMLERAVTYFFVT
ncbi:hypothetical protein [Lacipirellula sp.]|uniref:hypothetical protein n=1 Tax=Lacipirellula sp. TaxID=2691419 RepID=UPI003D12DF0A